MEQLIFGDFPEETTAYRESSVVVLPVPYDGTSTWLKGADKGPEAILNASGAMWYYDIETASELFRCGIHTAPAVSCGDSPESMVEAVYKRSRAILADHKFPLILGGEHSVSIGVFKALAEVYPELTIVQFDAHADLMDSYEGSRFNHACAMSRAAELFPVMHVGIRTLDRFEAGVIRNENTFYAHDIHGHDRWHDVLLNKIGSKVYITFDLDAFDPSLLPGTGTPEPGGMLWYEVISIIKKIIQKSELVGFDIVELCPRAGDRTSDYIAARLAHKILSYRFSGKAIDAWNNSKDRLH